jgi:hypothetical protein
VIIISKKNQPRPYEETHKFINGIIHKLCSDCNEWLPLADKFYKNKSAQDGYNPYCKNCTKKRSKQWQKENHERYLEICRKDNKSKDRKLQFKKNQERLREKGYHISYYENNKEQFSEYGKNRRTHKTHKITDEEWKACKEYFNNSCAYCGLPIEEHLVKYKRKVIHSDFHKEHVDDNGANDISNCVPSCKICNSSKHTICLEEWYNEDNPNFTQERLDKIHNWLNEDYKLI